MPPQDFDTLASGAFDQIKCALAVEAIYKPKLGGSFKIRGVFDDRVQEVDADTEQVVSSNAYTLGVKLADLPNKPKKGDRVEIKKVKYQVIEIQEDGVPDVSAVLVLHRTDP